MLARRPPSSSLRLDVIPYFLCPILLRVQHPFTRLHLSQRKIRQLKDAAICGRRLHVDRHAGQNAGQNVIVQSVSKSSSPTYLPNHCSGCGAFSQTVQDGQPGYYSISRKSVEEYIDVVAAESESRASSANRVLGASTQSSEVKNPPSPPLCDRCHQLLHHHNGVSIRHPSMESIQDSILESPHKYNHVYHILDAADFPMSLIPNLHRSLDLASPRSLNRRSKTAEFRHGKKTEVSYIITRSDLLAPLQTQVNALMPYLVKVLREALGSIGTSIRLGNVRCVSAKRGWWTREMKDDVWQRGGGGWMVGKVNVGKSQLFESVFPKGRYTGLQKDPSLSGATQNITANKDIGSEDERLVKQVDPFAPSSLLPPLQAETDFPEMPLVSPLAGTTASPIRVPFGRGRGELVDLPGLSRGDLELHVQEEHRASLLMRSRLLPEQKVIKPGQSLIIGGFIRITPTTPDVIIMAYSFTPIEPHLTSTEKAIGIQNQERESGVTNIAMPGTGEIIKSAGKFQLKWDVTKQRTGPLTKRSAVGLKVEQLPYRVLSTDIIIAGCGWVELVAQVSKRTLHGDATGSDPGFQALEKSSESNLKWPEVEVFSPDGKFIAARMPMGAWQLGVQRTSKTSTKSRPRRSMKSSKRNAKAMQRASST